MKSKISQWVKMERTCGSFNTLDEYSSFKNCLFEVVVVNQKAFLRKDCVQLACLFQVDPLDKRFWPRLQP